MEFTCPNCEVKFAGNTLNSAVTLPYKIGAEPPDGLHEEAQAEGGGGEEDDERAVRTQQTRKGHPELRHPGLLLRQSNIGATQEPVDDSYTQFKWQKAPIKLIQPNIYNLPP